MQSDVTIKPAVLPVACRLRTIFHIFNLFYDILFCFDYFAENTKEILKKQPYCHLQEKQIYGNCNSRLRIQILFYREGTI